MSGADTQEPCLPYAKSHDLVLGPFFRSKKATRIPFQTCQIGSNSIGRFHHRALTTLK